jgi:hypothetical protein
MKHETDIEFFIAYLVSIGANFTHERNFVDPFGKSSIIKWDKTEHIFTMEGTYLQQEVLK